MGIDFQLRSLIPIALLAVSATGFPSSTNAMEQIYYRDLRSPDEEVLRFTSQENVRAGRKMKVFVLGGWPELAEEPSPHPETTLSIIRGRKQNHDWANAYLLRVDPASYSWLTNGISSGLDEYLNMGSGPIVISFDQPICGFGATFAQAGAHNPHHPDLRRRTSFAFYGESGKSIAAFDQLPGHFIVKSAFSTVAPDLPIWAVVIESEVAFAVIELIARPCAHAVG